MNSFWDGEYIGSVTISGILVIIVEIESGYNLKMESFQKGITMF